MLGKLSMEQREKLYWDWWPYSFVELTFEQRLLDDKPARELIRVEWFINPTTFKLCKKHIDYFENDELVKFVLESARYNRQFRYYQVTNFYQQSSIPNSEKAAKLAKEELQKAILRMHKFIMDNYEI